jgi:serine protease Do
MSAIPKPVRSLHRAVVCVYAIGKNQEIQLTGFAVDSRGFIVCTGHDLRSAQMVSLLLSDGREIEGVVVKIDPVRDLALLQASTALDAVIPLRNGRFMLSNGDRLFAITCPFGGMANIEPGFLDGPPRRVAGLPLWQVQMHIDPGSSGSPVFDRQGRLVAIVKGRYRGTDSIGFLIPFETLLHFLEKY